MPRSPMNYRLIRATDGLLLYAEAALESSKDIAGAKWGFGRGARPCPRHGGDAAVLPEFPATSAIPTTATTCARPYATNAVSDLPSKATAGSTLCAGASPPKSWTGPRLIRQNESDIVRPKWLTSSGPKRTLPLPAEELDLNPMEQSRILAKTQSCGAEHQIIPARPPELNKTNFQTNFKPLNYFHHEKFTLFAAAAAVALGASAQVQSLRYRTCS